MSPFLFLSTFVLLVRGEKDLFYALPRFWTNTGFCPAGDITHDAISHSLLSKEVKVNLHLIGSLPNGALSSVRIHWLLELITFSGFVGHIPTYDFTKLDKLVWWLDRNDLGLGFELMGNPSEIFTKNHSIADYLWEDLSFQIGKRYLNRLGPKKLSRWRFESWNEPDQQHYNKLNFDNKKFQSYLVDIRRGLNAASRRPLNSVHLKLYGPAGLFKYELNHPLCWGALEQCNLNPRKCPFEVLTFHYKGLDSSHDVTRGGLRLMREIFKKYPNLTTIPVANDEADPASGWSLPRDSQAGVEYAIEVVSIIFDHWKAKLNTKTFANLDFISHDNAFISYHPHEFTQRTLLAHFRMNNSKPEPYSQFIQKPVYAALGMMGSLGSHAADIEKMEGIKVLRTCDVNCSTFFSLVALSETQEIFDKPLSLESMTGESVSYIVEFLEHQTTDPFKVWNFYGSPPFPNNTVREAMRRHQGPALFAVGILDRPLLYAKVRLRPPWLMQIRVCSENIRRPRRPRSLRIMAINAQEVLLLWKEKHDLRRCIVTYQVWFQPSNHSSWQEVTAGWHVPFLSFHFAPNNRIVQGTYLVRSIDSFGRFSKFSRPKNYM